MPNFSSIAGLEVAEKFVVVGWWVVEHVTTMSNSNAFAELRWVLTISFYILGPVVNAQIQHQM